MKKLMIALSAAALAFGLRADAVTLPHGTSFENNQAGPIEASGIVDDATGIWSTTDEAATLNITAYDGDAYEYQTTTRLTKFGSTQDKYLNLKTAFGKPLTRSIDIPIVSATDAGVYFDSLVKFTSCDEAPDVSSYEKAKIIVWALEIEDGEKTTTTLNVSANGGNYSLGTLDKSTGWHRLTIKTFANVNKTGSPVAGFAIFVDGEAKSCQDTDYETKFPTSVADKLTNNAKDFFTNKNLFITLDVGGTDYQTIKSVGFDGQGCIDDVAFTADAPVTAARDVLFCEIKLGEGVKSFVYGSETYTTAATIKQVTSVFVENIKYMDGYFGPETQELLPEGGNFTVVAQKKAVSINGKNYASFNEALADALIATTAKGATLKLESSLNFTDTIEISSAQTQITLDLNGQAITGAVGKTVFEVGSALLVKDSTGTGNITAVQSGSEPAYVIEATANVAIEGGTFEGGTANEGEVSVGFGGTGSITGGWFQHAPSSDLIAEGYAATVDATHDNYYKVAYLENGSEDHPWLIGSAADIESKLIANASKGHFFKQTQDIALTGVFQGVGVAGIKDLLNDKASGDASKFLNGAFRGVYDGQNYTISGVVLARGDYVGFFNSCYKATIKNLKIALGSETGMATEGMAEYCGGIFAGVTVDTDLINCVTVANAKQAFVCAKSAAGIVGYASDGTLLEYCTNNLAIVSENNEKVAGLISCAQAVANTNVVHAGKGEIVQNCASFGNVTGPIGENGKERIAGLVSYTDNEVTFKGANMFIGKLTGKAVQSVINLNVGTVNLGETATFMVPAEYKTVNQKAVDGLWFATVADGVATLIKNEAVVKDGSYKVMAPSAPAITLENIGDKITIDTSLAPVTVDTSATDAYVAQEGSVYTVTEKTTPTITVTLAEPITEYKSGLAFPTPTVEGATTYTTNWNPNAISEPAAGTTNEYVVTITVAATKTTKETTGSATWKVFKAEAPVGPVIPPGQGSVETSGDGKTATVTPAAGVTEITISGVGDAVETVSIPSTVTKITGVDPAKVQIQYVPDAVGAPTYDITAAFTKSGNATDGVTFELNPAGVVKVGEENVPVTPTISEAASTEGSIAEGAVATKAIPGLTYTLKRATSLAVGAEKVTADSEKATTGSVSLKDDISGAKPAAAFYTIEVSK